MKVLCSVALLGFLIPDLYAVGWTALWQSVIARNARAAEREAFTHVLFLPWILALFAVFLPLMLTGPGSGLVLFIVFYVLFSAVVDWWFARRARRKLHTELGLWALRRSAGELEHYDGWRRAGRWLGRWWSARRKGAIGVAR